MKIIKTYLNKNLFYLSVAFTGLTSLLFGLFYSLFKNNIFEKASSEFLEGTGVLSAYVTKATSTPSELNYFLIGLVLSLIFFFAITLIMSLYLKQKYFKIFNLFGILNIILIIGLSFSSLFINIFDILAYVILIITSFLYLIILYKCLISIFKLNKKKRGITLLIFVIPIILILIILKLFV